MFQITILLLYAIAGAAFALCRLPNFANRERVLTTIGFVFGIAALAIHGDLLFDSIMPEGQIILTMSAAISFIGLQLGLVGLLGAVNPALRGLSAGLLLLAAISGSAAIPQSGLVEGITTSWQIQTHVLVSMFAYGLLTVGAIVAVYALVQDRRLRTARLSSLNSLFAPLETTEGLLYGIAAAGFVGLALSVVSGITFVEDFFAQHLVHKTALSLLALLLFGILVAGRFFAGWRGKRAIYLYLGGFAILGLAYFGSRYILEEVLGRSWS